MRRQNPIHPEMNLPSRMRWRWRGRMRSPAAGLWVVVMLAVVVAGCATAPKRTDNACKIFTQKSSWYKHTRRAANKWNADMAVLLAIMKQESNFDANAKPNRKRFLGLPLWRPSSAFGYAQALDSTWRLYKKHTNRLLAQRDRFKDAMDFIGWYNAQTRARLKIPAHDAYRHYLAYHEGWGGYARGTYQTKKWLIAVAKRVAKQASRYRAQLKRCPGS